MPQWIVVGPVNEAAEIVPLVQATNLHAVTHTERHAFCEVEVVCDQQGLPIADIDDETLVTGTVLIVGQQAADEASDFNPPPVITFRKANASLPSPGPS